MNWLIAANSLMYDHASSFEHYGYIDWRQGNGRFEVNDIIYIYSTKPIQKIQYKCRVEKINLFLPNIRDDKQYWFDESEYNKSLSGKFMRLVLLEQVFSERMSFANLKLNGLNGPPQRPILVRGDLLKYIENNFTDLNQNEIFPDIVNEDSEVYEGIKKQVTVNKYERSSIARNKCIEYHGASCQICNMNFLEKYGEIGSGFIHIHHIIPIHQIGKEYKVNYKEDLIPVCPNCHAMLHQKINGKEPSIEELVTIIKIKAK